MLNEETNIQDFLPIISFRQFKNPLKKNIKDFLSSFFLHKSSQLITNKMVTSIEKNFSSYKYNIFPLLITDIA